MHDWLTLAAPVVSLSKVQGALVKVARLQVVVVVVVLVVVVSAFVASRRSKRGSKNWFSLLATVCGASTSHITEHWTKTWNIEHHRRIRRELEIIFLTSSSLRWRKIKIELPLIQIMFVWYEWQRICVSEWVCICGELSKQRSCLLAFALTCQLVMAGCLANSYAVKLS